MSILTPAQLAQFGRDGFVVAPRLFDPAQARDVLRWTEELERAPEEPGRHMVYGETSLRDGSSRIIQRIEYFCDFHDGFDRILRSGPLLDCVGDLFGEPAVLFKEKINLKLAGGGGFEPHQDQQAGWTRFASLFITALVAIDDANEENGCLALAAGQHKRGLLGPEWQPLTPRDMEGVSFDPVVAYAGDAIFFDSFVPHASPPNVSDRPRRVLYVTYNRASEGDQRERYFAEKRQEFPPDVERLPGKTYVYRV
jgi:2-aminoethylphosphonate dioxygenase